MKHNVELVFDKMFKENCGKTQRIFEKYDAIYQLEPVETECKVSKTLFEYCKRKDHFILLLIYSNDGKVALLRSLTNSLGWELPGGSIRQDETVYEAINRIAKQVYPNVKVCDVEPVLKITNTYVYKDAQTIHHGLGFIARIRNFQDVDMAKMVGDFVDVTKEERAYIERNASKKMVDIFLERFNQICNQTNYCFQDQEINTNEKYKARYAFHNKVIKRYFLTDKRKKKEQYKTMINAMLGEADSIIDVSCGEDKFIFNLSRERNMSLVVGNDISWTQIEQLNEIYDEVIFTNHNAACLPFESKIFDVSYCSNTLHHLPNKNVLKNLINNMLKISKKAIIVEIEDPKVTGGFAKWLNKNLYVKFLKDVGGAYLSQSQFELVVSEVIKDKANVKFNVFRNVMGKYMIAEITEKEDE